MRNTTFTLGVVLVALFAGAVRESEAFELRLGMQNIQMRDRAFKNFDGAFVDDLTDFGGLRFFNAAQAQFSGDWIEAVDLVGAIRLGSDSGRMEGATAELLLAEPAIGARKRFALPFPAEAYAQALVALPIMRARFSGAGAGKSYWAAFPAVNPAVGITAYPYHKGPKRNWAMSFEVGYLTPAQLSFAERDGISPGALNYGGLNYGIFVVWQSKPPRPVEKEQQPE